MYKILAVVAMLFGLTTTAIAQQKPPTMQTMKPVLCMETNALLKMFTDDKKEQLLSKFSDPLHNTIGMVWINKDSNNIHVIELAPGMGGAMGCIVVYGEKATLEETK
jgi:hypothetical protein|tara:strand:- start:414 stop:734 length:321 start_codon:yes stop_codon:yes gene_type:complete